MIVSTSNAQAPAATVSGRLPRAVETSISPTTISMLTAPQGCQSASCTVRVTSAVTESSGASQDGLTTAVCRPLARLTRNTDSPRPQLPATVSSWAPGSLTPPRQPRS